MLLFMKILDGRFLLQNDYGLYESAVTHNIVSKTELEIEAKYLNKYVISLLLV